MAQTLLFLSASDDPYRTRSASSDSLFQPRTTAVIPGQVPRCTSAAPARCWHRSPGRRHALRSVDQTRKTLQPLHILLVYTATLVLARLGWDPHQNVRPFQST
ncbi:uncharacterized protein TrAFT101_004878 [Trichoderma asperellum]|uniref:uncharacterized protein n=1 Tax=Trichoderma asperellum TaxID=101201 RepID=UPI00332096D9|nr:hypothetical protein TrAFT101_004878 [Trichoderma asperellum]